MEKIKNEILAQAMEYMKHREYLISIFFFMKVIYSKPDYHHKNQFGYNNSQR